MRPRSKTRSQKRKKRRNKYRVKTRRLQRGGRLGKAPIIHTPNISIQKVWLITVEPNGSRVHHFDKIATASLLPYTIYQGIRGSLLDTSDHSPLPSIGVSKIIYTSRGRRNESRNMGTVGCFLSHRNLYKKIVNEESDLNACHLVLEDDVIFPADIRSILQKTLTDVPDDWDIIYLSKGGEFVADKFTEFIAKLKKTTDGRSNFGTWAQIYRVGFLKEKMLPYLEIMSDELDSQINRKFDEWNAYCYNPPLVLLNPKTESLIEKLD